MNSTTIDDCTEKYLISRYFLGSDSLSTSSESRAFSSNFVNAALEEYRILSHFVNISGSESGLAMARQSTDPNWLSDALQEIEEASREADLEGFFAITSLAKSKAASLLGALATRVTEAPMVDPTPEGGISIDFRTEDRDGVLLICEPDGSGTYFESIGGKKGRGRYSDALDLLSAAGWSALTRAKIA